MRRSLWVVALGLMLLGGTALAEDGPQSQAQQRIAKRQLLTTLGGREPVVQLRQEASAPETATTDHPLFVTSYMGEPDRVVARTKYGPVTARDLYLHLIVSDAEVPPYLLELYDKAKLATEREELAEAVRDAIREFVYVNYVIPLERPVPPCHEVGQWKEYLYSLPGYQLAYLVQVVRPLIQIVPADRVKFLQENKAAVAEPDRWRVRYIFIESDRDDEADARGAAWQRLEDLRAQIAAGTLGFGEAARAHSDASSARSGGEIPPFRRGEMFGMFESVVRGLEPGEVSEVFEGPGGFYLVQLMEVLPAEEPSLDNPVHAARVEEGLLCQTLRAQFGFEVEKLLKHRPPVLRNNRWDERADDEVIGSVGDYAITKQQFQDAFLEIEDEELERRDDLIQRTLRVLLEREAMAQEVRACGFEGDPMLFRIKQFAANRVRYDCLRERKYCDLKVNEEVVRRFWRSNPDLFTPLPMQRVVRLTMTATNPVPTPQQVLEELRRVLNGATEQENLHQVAPDMPPGSVPQPVAPGGGAGPAEPAGGGVGRPRQAYEPRLGVSSSAMLERPRRRPLVPPLPLGYFPKIQPSVMRDKVLNYKAVDYILRFDDFGFVYVADRKDIPASVQSLPVGAYSEPKLRNGSAVCYYVEDERRLPKPAFEDIKSRVYSTYRRVTVERQMYEDMQRAVAKAGLEFTF
jgi:hypothetical protein